jgi:hypothetical protein
MAKDIPSGYAGSFRKGVSDSLLEDKKNYDGVFLPFDLPHKDDAIEAYKKGRQEGDELKKESEAGAQGAAYRRGLSDSLLDEKKDYDGKYKPFDLPKAQLASYKKGRVEGDQLKKEIEARSQD